MVIGRAGQPGTALYPPQFYLPAAAAIWIGRISGLTVTHTLTLARLMTGTAALIVGMTAIAFADAAAPWIFMILTLPMSLSLMASASEDALLISSSALAMALYIQIFRAPADDRPKLLLTLGVVLGMIFMARPPLAGAFVLPLTIANAKWRWRIAASAICVILVLGWSVIVSRTSMVNFGAGVGADPSRQMVFILSHPLAALSVLYHSISQQFRGLLGEFIGKLGWLDTVLPLWYYKAAACMLLVAALATMCGPKGWKLGGLGYALITLGLSVSIFGIFMIEYMSWTAPAAPVIQGVQGRYFLHDRPDGRGSVACLRGALDAHRKWLNRARRGLSRRKPGGGHAYGHFEILFKLTVSQKKKVGTFCEKKQQKLCYSGPEVKPHRPRVNKNFCCCFFSQKAALTFP